MKKNVLLILVMMAFIACSSSEGDSSNSDKPDNNGNPRSESRVDENLQKWYSLVGEYQLLKVGEFNARRVDYVWEFEDVSDGLYFFIDPITKEDVPHVGFWLSTGLDENDFSSGQTFVPLFTDRGQTEIKEGIWKYTYEGNLRLLNCDTIKGYVRVSIKVTVGFHGEGQDKFVIATNMSNDEGCEEFQGSARNIFQRVR